LNYSHRPKAKKVGANTTMPTGTLTANTTAFRPQTYRFRTARHVFHVASLRRQAHGSSGRQDGVFADAIRGVTTWVTRRSCPRERASHAENSVGAYPAIKFGGLNRVYLPSRVEDGPNRFALPGAGRKTPVDGR
jgi:hypothetical protein